MIIFFHSASLNNFSTSQKSRIRTSDFRPTLKANEMALGLKWYLLCCPEFKPQIVGVVNPEVP